MTREICLVILEFNYAEFSSDSLEFKELMFLDLSIIEVNVRLTIMSSERQTRYYFALLNYNS